MILLVSLENFYFTYENGFVLAFSDTGFSLLTVGQFIYDSTHYTYCVFDSYLRDSFGNPSLNGVSVLVRFKTLEELCIYIQNQLFDLIHVPVLITDDLQSQFNWYKYKQL